MLIRMFGGISGLLVASIFGIRELSKSINNNSSFYPPLFWLCFGVCIILLSDDLKEYIDKNDNHDLSVQEKNK